MRLMTKVMPFWNQDKTQKACYTNECIQVQTRSEFDAAASEMRSINQIRRWLGGWSVGLFGGEVGVRVNPPWLGSVKVVRCC